MSFRSAFSFAYAPGIWKYDPSVVGITGLDISIVPAVQCDGGAFASMLDRSGSVPFTCQDFNRAFHKPLTVKTVSTMLSL